ncbi:Rhodopirellula transposase family protein, partial [mine drainage metagenome]
GRRELESDLSGRPLDRVRLEGGGRPPVEKKNAAIEPALMKLVEDHAGGDPMTERKWVRRSLRHLSKDLRKQGHAACPNTTSRLLRKRKFSLKSNRKGRPVHRIRTGIRSSRTSSKSVSYSRRRVCRW